MIEMNKRIYHELIADQDFCNRLKPHCLKVSDRIDHVYGGYILRQHPSWMDWADGSNSTKLYEAYNIFLIHYEELTELYEKIVNYFKEKNSNTFKEYAIAGWVNVFPKGKFLDWHTHGVEKKVFDGRWHGYFCVNGEPSKTLYAENDTGKLIETIENKNGWLVMSPGGMLHRVTPWKDSREPRITIAFDIMLRSKVPINNINHWIPIL